MAAPPIVRELVERSQRNRVSCRAPGTAKVAAAFLAQIDGWRELLARHFAHGNPELSQPDLNFAVRRTIERLIFLRMCEDRGIENHGQLLALSNGPRVLARLREVLDRAGERYHSDLFHFHAEEDRAASPDTLTPALVLDDESLQVIIRALYGPDSACQFSVLPKDILGRVYEQFLGKSIRLMPAGRAIVEDKPGAKKAGGVYYTPAPIVEHIVKNTVGKLVEGQSPKQVAKLRALDPACGAGSFLIGALQFLLDWHRDWYVADGVARHAKEIIQGPGGQWFLAPAEKKRILLNNIHGVDIDSQAVEVTKLSLLLTVLERENRGTCDRQARQGDEPVPDLAGNIKCGNALVGPDFYDQRPMSRLNDEERRRINAFDWKLEFPSIFHGHGGGFDAVIGNPPWGQKAIGPTDALRQYIQRKYPSAAGVYDLFRPFVEQGIRLARADGWFGIVLPDIVLLKDCAATRKLLLDELALEAIDWWKRPFASAVIDAATIVGRRYRAPARHHVRVEVHDRESPLRHEIGQDTFLSNPRYTFNLFLTPRKRDLLERLAEFPTLGTFLEIHEGVHSGNMRGELFVDERLDETCQEMIFGRGEIAPYALRWQGRFVRLGALPKRRTRNSYANAGNADWYHRDKLLVRRTGDYVLAAVDREQRYASNNFFIAFPKVGRSSCLDGLCALLNSSLITWFFRAIEPRQGRVFAELKIKHIREFPAPRAFLAGGGDEVLRNLGKQRADCGAKLLGKSPPHDTAILERQRAMLDHRINSRVLELF